MKYYSLVYDIPVHKRPAGSALPSLSFVGWSLGSQLAINCGSEIDVLVPSQLMVNILFLSLTMNLFFWPSSGMIKVGESSPEIK